MSSVPQPPDSPASPEMIEAAAAAWLSLRDRGMNAAETAEFVRWLQQDAQHSAVFAELDRTWKDLDRLAAVPAADAPEPDGDLLAPRMRPRRHRVLAWTSLGAAAAATILLLTATYVRTLRPTAETTVGAFQKLDLPDGSVAQLNTDSAIDMTFTGAERRVHVIRGEVYFSVAKDPSRPFVVVTGPVAVRALGTAFNVRQHDAAIEVLVTEGRVRVDFTRQRQTLVAPSALAGGAPLLVAGERAIVSVPARASAAAPAPMVVTKISALEVRRALAWQERRLEFDAVPLADVAREFNRYNRRQLVIADDQLAAKRFSGTFRADGYEPFVRLLEEDFGVAATRTAHEIVLRLHP